MSEDHTSLTDFYKGWDVYQQHLVQAVAPLTSDQLTLRAAPHLRSIGDLIAHLVAVRVRWFHDLMGQGSSELAPIGTWDRPDAPTRTATEFVTGLETTWQMMQDALAHWTPADLEYIYQGSYQGEEYKLSRQWIIWHVIEHDLHHGGELAFSLGMHSLAAPDI